VAKLLEYITQPAGMDADDKRQFKYPFSSCEVGSQMLTAKILPAAWSRDQETSLARY